MNDFCVSPNGDVVVYRYVNITMPGYERPDKREFDLLDSLGYEYKGASECYSTSIYMFEYRCGEGWHKVQATSREEAAVKAIAA